MQYDLSYWERRSFFDDLDVVVIGSGIVGLAAAMHLRHLRPTWRVAVMDRGALPIGASTRNAGFACFGSMTELLDDLTHMPESAVLAVVEQRWRGLQRLRELVGDAHLGLQMAGGYEMFTDAESAIFAECKEKIGYFNQKIGHITGHPEVYRIADEHLPRFGFGRSVQHLVLNQAEGQLHTGQLMSALLRMARERGVELYGGVDVARLHDDGQAGVHLESAAGWSIRVPQVLVCTNGFAQQLLPELAVTPARNQVLITRPVADLRVEGCFHYDRGYFYFRNVEGRILLGGGRNLDPTTEQTANFGPNPLIRAALERLLREVIAPDQSVEIDTWWTGILGLGPAKQPIVQRVSPHVSVAVRMSGMGVAIGALVGQEGAEVVVS
jgi:gamma-glutamylputrescine oxidase